eukprot:TRINITY_DN7780_c0_g1_i1.p1 TRINITY_DN7780_c0_g1~~TRINITY_DN7780_c0_g1_i1.p1  ORF type:complete len:246 (-),score=31.39 TRINITY_DN7780_c0_g1_i1:61-726(-)
MNTSSNTYSLVSASNNNSMNVSSNTRASHAARVEPVPVPVPATNPLHSSQNGMGIFNEMKERHFRNLAYLKKIGPNIPTVEVAKAMEENWNTMNNMLGAFDKDVSEAQARNRPVADDFTEYLRGSGVEPEDMLPTIADQRMRAEGVYNNLMTTRCAPNRVTDRVIRAQTNAVRKRLQLDTAMKDLIKADSNLVATVDAANAYVNDTKYATKCPHLGKYYRM